MLTPAELCWDDGVPRSARFNDIYHSADGAREVQRVFIRPGNLQARFADPTLSTFTIGELGFGTGLNFAAVVQLFLESARPGMRLHFISVEKQAHAGSGGHAPAFHQRRKAPDQSGSVR